MVTYENQANNKNKYFLYDLLLRLYYIHSIVSCIGSRKINELLLHGLTGNAQNFERLIRLKRCMKLQKNKSVNKTELIMIINIFPPFSFFARLIPEDALKNSSENNDTKDLAERNQTILSSENNQTKIVSKNNQTNEFLENNQTKIPLENNQTKIFLENNQTKDFLENNRTKDFLENNETKIFLENNSTKLSSETNETAQLARQPKESDPNQGGI